MKGFQEQVATWVIACFGAKIAENTKERNHRFLEEALELVQSCGCKREDVNDLVAYVYNRRCGEKSQEVGGVMVTLAALCEAQNLDMSYLGKLELNRVWSKIDKIREKQQKKPKASPLPQTLIG